MKKNIAVLFGGKSTEHDVSILTGIQACEALDSGKYNVIPVYIDKDNIGYTGDALWERKRYHFSKDAKRKLLSKAALISDDKNGCRLAVSKRSLLGVRTEYKPVDMCLLAFHGSNVEDGNIQGELSFRGIPYTGCRVLASSIFMNKKATKLIAKAAGVPVVDDVVIYKPDTELFDVEELTKGFPLPFPVCVKPGNLGSSVGVSIAKDVKELNAGLLKVFKVDNEALVEIFVPNLVEYNVSVTKAFGEPRVSALERPLKDSDSILSFAHKYLNNGPLDSKLAAGSSEGMVSQSRVFNPPELTEAQIALIKDSAIKIFNAVKGAGGPRIDFMCNSKTGEIWLCEVNPIPGSFAYYLWEQAVSKVSFPSLLDALIDEGLREQAKVPQAFIEKGSTIFKE